MSTSWDDYLRLPDASLASRECHLRCKNRFDLHRNNIQRVFDATRPDSVACLGTGVLNDIPYRWMVEAGASIHLVDWLPGIIDAGLALSIIGQDEHGQPNCIYCTSAIDCPEQYCRHYRESRESVQAVCDRFMPTSEPPLRCKAFERAEFPIVHHEDVTRGYASEFGRGVDDELRGVRSWKQAFARGMALAQNVKRYDMRLNIADASIKLVTSSMLLSQFDHEPYEYFTRRVAAKLGPPSENEEKRLLPTMESLRKTLLTTQIERHCMEIKRMLAPGGRCYMSFEVFHTVPDSTNWFVVKGMADALEIVGRHFLFDFDIIPQEEMITRFATRGAPSLVFSFVLLL